MGTFSKISSTPLHLQPQHQSAQVADRLPAHRCFHAYQPPMSKRSQFPAETWRSAGKRSCWRRQTLPREEAQALTSRSGPCPQDRNVATLRDLEHTLKLKGLSMLEAVGCSMKRPLPVLLPVQHPSSPKSSLLPGSQETGLLPRPTCRRQTADTH